MEPPIRCELPPDLHELTLQILVFVPIHFESGSRVQEPALRPLCLLAMKLLTAR